jgi:hypothetical protein
MRLPDSSFDHDSVALMGRVCDEAWREVQATTFFPSVHEAGEVVRQLATRVMVAVAEGEPDPHRLKAIAMDGIEAG